MYDDVIARREFEEKVSDIEERLLAEGSYEGVCSLLRESGDPAIIAAAARAAAGWRFLPAERLVALLVRDADHRADPMLARELAAALGKFGGQDAVDGLLRMVVFEGTDPAAGVAAHKALSGLGSTGLWLLGVVLGQPEWKRRTYFSKALRSRIEAELERLKKEVAGAGREAGEQKKVEAAFGKGPQPMAEQAVAPAKLKRAVR